MAFGIIFTCEEYSFTYKSINYDNEIFSKYTINSQHQDRNNPSYLFVCQLIVSTFAFFWTKTKAVVTWVIDNGETCFKCTRPTI